MRKKEQLYEVEIKSQSLLREGKKGLITYFQGGNHQTVANHIRLLYPQYTKTEDKPMFNITPITKEEYRLRSDSGVVKQKAHLMKGSAHINEIMGN